MAASSASSGPSQVRKECETINTASKVSSKHPRRQLTLIAITALLHMLLWSSIACIAITIYQIAARPEDTTNVPTEVLTMISALTTITYVILHMIFSLKQKIWRHQRRHPSIVKKTSYIAVRVAVSLCILWLLTSGWNMITVARRPTCLPSGAGLLSWEAGPTCYAGRLSIAVAMIALIASCTLFWMLSVVRRPFEAHLLTYGKVNSPSTLDDRSIVPHGPVGPLNVPFPTSHNRGRASSPTQHSNTSNADVDTLDLNSASSPPSILSPSPMRLIGIGIFTSEAQPPPLPAAFAHPHQDDQKGPSPPIFHPSTQHPPPFRMSTLISSSSSVPLPAQFSASSWRAVHPIAPPPLGPLASRSFTHLPQASSLQNYTYRSRFSRSSISLTRPHRLSTATPVASAGHSSRSGSTGPDEGRDSPSSGEGDFDRKATSHEIAYAILNGLPIPGTQGTGYRARGHVRHSSAPHVAAGSQQSSRMGKGWKPQLKERNSPELKHLPKITTSTSAGVLSKFSPDTSPEDERISFRNDFGKDVDLRLASERFHPVRKIRSADPLRQSPLPSVSPPGCDKASLPRRGSAASDVEAGAAIPEQETKRTFEEMKNKPLPKIAIL